MVARMTVWRRGVTSSGAPRPSYAPYKTPRAQLVGRQEAPSGSVPLPVTRARPPSASASAAGGLRLRRRGWTAADECAVQNEQLGRRLADARIARVAVVGGGPASA